MILIIASVGCNHPQDTRLIVPLPIIEADSSRLAELTRTAGYGALLLTRFKSFAELKSIIRIEYEVAVPFSSASMPRNARVLLSHRSGGVEVHSELESGISETEFMQARSGRFWDKALVGLRSPYAAIHKNDLMAIEHLGRRRPWVNGKGDVAFYDLAEAMVQNISEEDSLTIEDLSEKGYLNTFNHVTAQAFMTSIFSERLADFIADVHERRRMPELITGNFTALQVADLENGPLDNYIDLINNEWGQEIGKYLRSKYKISRMAYWTPGLMADYLNEIQSYHSRAFQIGFVPFRDTDEMVIRFAGKINGILGIEPGKTDYW